MNSPKTFFLHRIGIQDIIVFCSRNAFILVFSGQAPAVQEPLQKLFVQKYLRYGVLISERSAGRADPAMNKKNARRRNVQVFKHDLSPEHRTLLELMESINFGCIENILVEDGRPVITGDTLVEREIKLGGLNGPRLELAVEDFALKQTQIDLFNHIAQMEDGRISRIEVKNGLPFLMRVTQTVV